MAHALRVPMIGVSSLDLLAFPVRFTTRLHRRRDRRPARRGVLRVLPPGARRRAAAVARTSVGTPDDLASELLATGEECLLVGDGALRYRRGVRRTSTRVEIGDAGLAYPSAASLVQLAHAQALREECVQPWDLQPLYLRKPDAEINWSTRGSGA